MKTKCFLLTVGIVFAMAFTFSCSDGSENSNISTCGGKEYDREYQHCDNGEIKEGAEINRSSSSVGGQGGWSSGSLIYEGQTYKTVKIGEQVWFAENLNYNAPGSRCYGEGGEVIVDWDNNDIPITETLSPDEIQANCTKYGRLYDWSTAMKLPQSCNNNMCPNLIEKKHQGICPSGWHIPSNADWDVLVNYAGGTSTAGTKLKARSGWSNMRPPFIEFIDGSSGNGTDDYGFSALPGGYSYSKDNSSFHRVGDRGLWWTATEYDSDNSNFAYYWHMHYGQKMAEGNGTGKSDLLSVRCLKN